MDPIHGYQCSKCGKSFEIVSTSQQEAARSAAVCCCDPKKAGPVQVGDYVDDGGGKWKVWFVGDNYAYVSEEFRYASLEWSEPRRVCLHKLRAWVNNVDVPKPTTIADCPPGEYRKEFEDLIGDLEFFKPDPVAPEGSKFQVGDKIEFDWAAHPGVYEVSAHPKDPHFCIAVSDTGISPPFRFTWDGELAPGSRAMGVKFYKAGSLS
jgi:hypothetical protein